LHITVKREQAEALGTVYYRPRPLKIDKRVLLPISPKEEEEEEEEEKVEGKATYENGIVTLRMPVPRSTNIPIT
jgi:HSP20 family protein